MIERFTGQAGAANLKEAMLQQYVVQHDHWVAARFIAAGTLAAHPAGEVLIQQGSADEYVFFILSGEVEIVVNGRVVGKRSATETVGEMTAVDSASPRSATVRASSATVTFRVSCAEFVDVAEEFPKVWRAAARQLGERLRQRNRFHRTSNTRPILFVGSSPAGLATAQHLQRGLKNAPCEVRVWTSGVFGPAGAAVDELLAEVEQADFAAFIFGPDESLSSQGAGVGAARDNIIFEMGLFLSQLGRERTYLVKEEKAELDLPLDLLEISPLTYVAAADAKWESALSLVCREITTCVKGLGVR